MKRKIIGIMMCMLMIATAVPAVTSLENNEIHSMILNHPLVSMAGNWTEIQKLTPSDGATNDMFSECVSIDGFTALIGAWSDDDNGVDSGSAYVFTLNGTNWTQQAKLLPSDGAPYDEFGNSVSISGDTALIGAWWDDDNGDYSGSAYVFVRWGSTWVQQAKLHSSDNAEGDNFGNSVSLDGNIALIGAWGNDDNGDRSGSAYVFTRNGTTWTQQQKLFPSNGAALDYFGLSVSISGNTALIGEYGYNASGNNTGSAYVFTRTGTTSSLPTVQHGIISVNRFHLKGIRL
jgi:hypothetical protein